MTTLNKFVKFVGVKQGSSALPAFDLRGNKGKADETFALPLQIGWMDGLIRQKLGGLGYEF